MPKDISIEYAHIYTNQEVGKEQRLSLEVLKEIKETCKNKSLSLVVLVDDYSFPDTAFSYANFSEWLALEDMGPDIILRESKLVPYCDQVLALIEDAALSEQVVSYINNKKYPCSLFIAAWYLIRLGRIYSDIFPKELVAQNLINILPESFRPYEEKGFEIINATKHRDVLSFIDNRYFEGRSI